MPLVSMDVRDDDNDAMSPSDYDPCPCLYLSAAQVKALGIDAPLRAGSRVMITASAMVETSSESVDGDDDDPDIRLTLKVTDMEIGGYSGQQNATLLYGG